MGFRVSVNKSSTEMSNKQVELRFSGISVLELKLQRFSNKKRLSSNTPSDWKEYHLKKLFLLLTSKGMSMVPL